MTPHSPGTDQIDTLLWIGLIAAAIVVVLVNAALIFALRGKRRAKATETSEASRPTTSPAASITTHFFSTSAGFAE